MHKFLSATCIAVLTAALSPAALAQSTASFSSELQAKYRVIPNVTYLTAENYQVKLDIYQSRDTSTPQPTVMFFHGGGWVQGTKESSILSLVPYFEMGWNVVNVEYRMAEVALAPAAVEDCICALRWVTQNAKQYNIDTARIVTSGTSAGGHLALTTAMIPLSAGLDRRCPGGRAGNVYFGPEELKVAAVVNWYGVTDVGDVMEGPNRRIFGATWLGGLENRKEIAARVSPLTYVRPGLPPVISIQGDADGTVPYAHSVRLHAALEKAGVPNKLLTVPGGGHGNFKASEYPALYDQIRDFLSKHGLMKRGS